MAVGMTRGRRGGGWNRVGRAGFAVLAMTASALAAPSGAAAAKVGATAPGGALADATGYYTQGPPLTQTFRLGGRKVAGKQTLDVNLTVSSTGSASDANCAFRAKLVGPGGDNFSAFPLGEAGGQSLGGLKFDDQSSLRLCNPLSTQASDCNYLQGRDPGRRRSGHRKRPGGPQPRLQGAEPEGDVEAGLVGHEPGRKDAHDRDSDPRGQDRQEVRQGAESLRAQTETGTEDRRRRLAFGAAVAAALALCWAPAASEAAKVGKTAPGGALADAPPPSGGVFPEGPPLVQSFKLSGKKVKRKQVLDVNVTVNSTGSAAGANRQLRAKLISPGGDSVTVLDGPGNQSLVNLTYDDQSELQLCDPNGLEASDCNFVQGVDGPRHRLLHGLHPRLPEPGVQGGNPRGTWRLVWWDTSNLVTHAIGQATIQLRTGKKFAKG